MTLAQARAHCSTLSAAEAPSEEENNRTLAALGRWLMRFSPNVSLAPPSSIFLDATGFERLFPDRRAWMDRIARTLLRLHFDCSLAIAPTPAAAWALAAFGHDLDLNELPPAALRLPAERCLTLHSLGLNTIGLLRRIPRNELTRRFPDVLHRLDQMTGKIPEPLDWLTVHLPVRAEVEFEGPIESLETIEVAIRQLIDPLVESLARTGRGARRLRLTLRRPYAASVEKTIEFIRPSRQPKNLLNLLMRSLERLDGEANYLDGFIGIDLEATMTERLDHEQVALTGDDDDRLLNNRDHLIERLRARFGDVVEWLEPLESHLPERAFRCTNEFKHVPLRADISSNAVDPRQTACGFATTPSRKTASDHGAATLSETLPRPLCLLPRPRSIGVMLHPRSDYGRPISFTDAGEVHQLLQINGPERIAGIWWNGGNKTRDYFDVQTIEGNRFWLFQVIETNAWYLHGTFE